MVNKKICISAYLFTFVIKVFYNKDMKKYYHLEYIENLMKEKNLQKKDLPEYFNLSSYTINKLLKHEQIKMRYLIVITKKLGITPMKILCEFD